MLDNSTVKYIFDYFSRFMTVTEYAALKHYMTTSKFDKSLSNDLANKNRNFLTEKGWLSGSKDVLELLKNGFDNFQNATAERILKENRNKIYFNNCPKCGLLARTPQAKQCRFCKYSWHNHVVGAFKIVSTFQMTGRQFFIFGSILSGSIKTGMKVDLTTIGLAIKPTIEGIEFLLHREQNIAWEDTGLALSNLTNEEKEYLKINSPFSTPVPLEQ